MSNININYIHDKVIFPASTNNNLFFVQEKVIQMLKDIVRQSQRGVHPFKQGVQDDDILSSYCHCHVTGEK